MLTNNFIIPRYNNYLCDTINLVSCRHNYILKRIKVFFYPNFVQASVNLNSIHEVNMIARGFYDSMKMHQKGDITYKYLLNVIDSY